MKPSFNTLAALFIAAFVGCSDAPSGTNAPAARPDDFRIDYEWREGSLPPPYHYQYSIAITPAGDGHIELTPDYPGAEAPTWTEKFKVTEERFDQLYKALTARDLFTRSWRQSDDPRVGGSSQTLTVTAGGQRYVVEDYLVEDQVAAAEAMYEAVNALAPKEAWDRLNAKREQYREEHPRK